MTDEEKARHALVAEMRLRLEKSPGDEDRRLGRLVEDLLAMGADLDLATVLQRVVEAAARAVDARYGSLGVLNEEGVFTELFTTGTEPGMRAAVGHLPHSTGILGHLVREPYPIRVPDLAADPRSTGFPPNHPVMHSLLGGPIRIRDTVYGNLYLTDRRDGQPFSRGDENLLTALANVAGAVIENARHHERLRATAEDLQRHLLPELPDLGPLQIQARYHPAHSSPRVGGDWYQAFPGLEGAWSIVVGDVVGHDTSSALTMYLLSSMLYVLTLDEPHAPARIVQRLDQALHRTGSDTMATLIVATLHPRPNGSWRLRWTNAGHPPPLVLTPAGAATYLDPSEAQGIMIGVDPTQAQPEHSHTLEPGTTLLLYTDGLVEDPQRPITECLDGLATLAESLAGAPLEQLCDEIMDARPAGPHRDDAALLVLGIPAGPAAQSALGENRQSLAPGFTRPD
ncbi:SpoIIE family protein phosphatase [Streptomyces sp. NBC_01341]|uniref:PP2C family protein-serine/threonine phosphatase n=1 Tax=Streptomyces sp. NBC_01341 TaxID=2903831 RepID=UPI002E15EF8A|nr:SpoIIE family protein phosphatase [Streptomyces sp. NBC_01341]